MSSKTQNINQSLKNTIMIKTIKIILTVLGTTFLTWIFLTSVYYFLTDETFIQTAISTNVKFSMAACGWYPALLFGSHVYDN